ncbi:hypothetical protein PSPTOT1_2828 [Pseudomonas syringae pv. tomato T1]|nr:hypothetical protein PSPTOT1_2828 [Pseudomonas syringae pv. tomato T1]KPB80088.1 Uncharacterized protein AC505_1210 [Pseudomonas syringae pv. maculicola]
MCQAVPPQVFGLVGRIDDGVWQAVFAVEVFGLVAKRVGLDQQIASGVVAGLPRAAVGVGRLGHQRGRQMMFVSDLAPERVGFFNQPREVVVFEGQRVVIGQYQPRYIAVFVDIDGVVFATVITAGSDATVFVVMNFQFAAQHINGPRGALFKVIPVMVMLAIAGPVFDHAGLAVDGFPAVVTVKAQCIAVAGHHAVGVREAANGIAIAVVDVTELAVVVVVVTREGFNSFLVDDALHRRQPSQRVLVLQVHMHITGGADVGQGAFLGTAEMQVMTECIFDALQRNRLAVVRHFAEVEEDVVLSLQHVVAALRADQVHLLVRVVDTVTGLDIDEGHTAPLIVDEVNKAAISAQALLPGQHPAFAQDAVDIQVAGVKARPFNGHQSRQCKVGFTLFKQ